ncbi:MAG: pilus assembly protein TadG-related protein [Pirellulaceae bacterium]
MSSQRRFKCTHRRRGAVAVLVAALLTVILGLLVITLEGGLLRDNRRKVQGAADAAALAAATQLFVHYPAIEASDFHDGDPGGAGVSAALASAADNGFQDGVGDSSVVVNIPPTSGPFKNEAGYAETVVTFNQTRYFSRIWGGTSTPVLGRAVARGRWMATNIGIMVLEPTAKNALIASGTGAVTVTGGSPGTDGAAVIVNSDNTAAAAATGGGGLTAPRFQITGGYTGTLNGDVETGVPPSPDPLRHLPEPSVTVAGKMTVSNLGNGNKQYSLTPGTYTNLPNFNVGDVVVFRQGGIYSIDGGGFKSTGASIQMDPDTSGGVMIYNNPSGSSVADQIQISGNSAGTVNLSALTDGPYAGILLWQKRTATQQLSISGGGNFSMTGTFYAANAQLNVTGSGDALIGSQYISRTLSLGGGGNTLIRYSDEGTARLREVILVE